MFKKLIVVLGVIFLLSTNVFAAGIYVDNITNNSGVVNIAVPSTGTVYSQSFPISQGQYFEVSYKAASVAGSIDLTIQLEQSFQTPATEGAADTTYTIPVGTSDIVTNLTTESTWYHQAFNPVALPYVRFKITGNGSNNADTIVNLKISKQTIPTS